MSRCTLSIAVVGASLLVSGLLPGDIARTRASDERGDSEAKKLFDADPAHPWNRLHQLFYVRAFAQGHTYTHHGTEAPFGWRGRILVEEPLHTRTLEALDAFLRARDDGRVKDPLKRALLQRDLWYVFDKLAEQSPYGDSNDAQTDKQPQRRALEKRLAQVMRRLEQSSKQLGMLPDNYAIAVKSKAFPAVFDPERPEQPYLPADLRVDGQGDWVLISRYSNNPTLAAPFHAQFTQGRSVFIALLRLPGGRKQTEAYLARLPRFDERGDRKFPPLPDGSQVAFVRQMLLMDDRGTLQPTPVTESVQLRAFPRGDEQRFVEFTLDRAALLSGGGGLRAVGAAEKEYFGFGISHDASDPFGKGVGRQPVVVLSNCVRCHAPSKLPSINTFGFGFAGREGYQGAAQTDLAAQVRHTVDLKTNSYEWGLLQGLRETVPP